jgi:cytochrome c oxidase subunit 2
MPRTGFSRSLPGLLLTGLPWLSHGKESFIEGKRMVNKTRLVTAAVLCASCLRPAFCAADRTIEIHAHRYEFTPSEITVKRGETVTLKLFSDDVTHSLQVKDLGINQTITKGKPAEVTFTPQKTGDFHGQCGHFCGAGHGKMAIAVHVTGN